MPSYPRAALISDLHLSAAWPVLTEVLLRFLAGDARKAPALFLLGDIFEAWIGDDDDEAWLGTVAEALRGVADAGTEVYFMHGNRDFLLGADYARRCGMRLLADPSVVIVGGIPTLLAHGDALCTDEVDYQLFRARSRTSAWQSQVLAQPLSARRQLAQELRGASKAEHQRRLAAAEMLGDVNPQAVREAMRDARVQRLIHGHTHRPDEHAVDGLRRPPRFE